MPSIDYTALSQQYGSKIEKRIAGYQIALNRYKSVVEARLPESGIYVKDDMATLMGYFAYHCNNICAKPFVRGLSDRYKIASITELAVCYFQPFASKSSEVDLEMLNASFAIYCAFNVMENFRDEGDSMHFSQHDPADRFDCALVGLKERMDKMLENHALYLSNMNSGNEELPLISNAFTLEMMHIIYDYKWQALAN